VNYVPGYLIYTEHWQTISDDWLCSERGGCRAGHVHRPAAGQLGPAGRGHGAKIVSYETRGQYQALEKKLLAVADNAADSWRRF